MQQYEVRLRPEPRVAVAHRSVEENLRLFEDMRQGKFAEGEVKSWWDCER